MRKAIFSPCSILVFFKPDSFDHGVKRFLLPRKRVHTTYQDSRGGQVRYQTPGNRTGRKNMFLMLLNLTRELFVFIRYNSCADILFLTENICTGNVTLKR